MSSADLEIIDGAVPLVRNEPWEWFVVFLDDPQMPTDLVADPVTVGGATPVLNVDGEQILTGANVVAAEIRWSGGALPVTAETVADGQVRLSLLAAATAALPLGRLAKLFIAVDADTECVVPVDILEGLYR